MSASANQVASTNRVACRIQGASVTDRIRSASDVVRKRPLKARISRGRAHNALCGAGGRTRCGLAGASRIGAARGGRARHWEYGDPGPGALGSTDWAGNITIRRGLSGDVLMTTLRHETVHSVLTPMRGPFLGARRRIRQGLYNRSGLARYAEEALAEGYATRSILRGLRYPFGRYVSGRRVAGEAVALGASAYGGYEAVP
jgi:hypothetical protein